jgi:membrane-associated phospholipid phosphatase
MVRLIKRLALPLLVFVLAFSACTSDNNTPTPVETVKLAKDYDSKVVQQWIEMFMSVERYAEVYRPCPAARMMGYVGFAAYEAAVPGMPEYQSIAGRYPNLVIPAVETGKEYHWPTVINNVYATLFKKFFANVKASDLFKIASLESTLNVQASNALGTEVFNRSKAYGISVANAVWDYSATDKEGHDKYLDPRPSSYTPPVGPGKWTAPVTVKPMYPYWGKVRTFAISESDRLARAPIPYSEDKTSAYYAQGLEVYAATTPQTYENQWIAEFWSDDVLGFTFSPAVRVWAVEAQVLAQQNSNLETAIMASVRSGLAVNDAAVACWYSKYYYNVERPNTYITKFINPNWNVASLTSTGFLPSTPAFPAYPSGHSTMGAAGFAGLAQVFGEHISLTDRCHENRTDFNGKPRAFNTFSEMAWEDAISRIYLGVHWRMDCEEGVRLGFQAARKVNALPFKK